MDDSLKPFFVASLRILELGPAVFRYHTRDKVLILRSLDSDRGSKGSFYPMTHEYNPSYDTHLILKLSFSDSNFNLFANLSGYRYRSHSTRNGVLVELGGCS